MLVDAKSSTRKQMYNFKEKRILNLSHMAFGGVFDYCMLFCVCFVVVLLLVCLRFVLLCVLCCWFLVVVVGLFGLFVALLVVCCCCFCLCVCVFCGFVFASRTTQDMFPMHL